MKYIKPLNEKKPKDAPGWHDADYPDAEGRFRDLSPKDLAAWLIKTRKKDMSAISGALVQQVVFNRQEDPEYADKMEKTRKEVYKQLDRQDLLDKMDESIDEAINEKKQLPKEIAKHKDIPSWARYVAQQSDGEWTWYEETPTMINFRGGGGAWKQDGNQTYTGVKTDGKDWDKMPTYYYVKGEKISESVLNEEDSYNDYPAAAKANAKKAIEWKEKYGRDEVDAGTAVGWQRAHQLAKGEKVSADTVKRMASFNRHRKNSSIKAELKDTPWKDKGYVSWLIWGGDEGVDWAMEKSKEIDAMKEAKEFKHIKPLYESLGSYEYSKWIKENGKIKYPKWIGVKSKEIIDGGFMDKVYKGEHHYMSIWLGSFDNKSRSELFAYSDRGKKEFGEMGYKFVQRFWNDITGYTMFFWQGAMYALEVSKHIKDMQINGEEVEPGYYLMKNYFNSFGMDTNRSRTFNAAVEKLEQWMKDNNIETL